jgi:uncharacterized protein YdiU (UPF0061 family)
VKLEFDNRFREVLPQDPEGQNYTRQVRGAFWSDVQPTQVAEPKLLAHSQEMAERLGLGQDIQSDAFAKVFGGNDVIEGMEPFATCYGGHQFGHWAGQLGDGRAISLGEAITKSGERWELQLKGAGPTPYSRSADGRAVLRSSVREFLCSEAMHHLGVPTTRALSLVDTGDPILRDMFYDGRPGYEPGAVVCRVAPSFIRFGHFELPASRRENDLVETLVNFTIRRDFPHLGEPSRDVIPLWLSEVAKRTALMAAHWMRVGFVHGVMNTDNMSILGLTIDYGPYGWLEGFEPGWTPNTTDAGGKRYAYGKQPDMALWNLQCLVGALFPLIDDQGVAEDILKTYVSTFQSEHDSMMAAKLGLRNVSVEDDDMLIRPLLHLLQQRETDMTLFYRGLADVPVAEGTSDSDQLDPLAPAYYNEAEGTDGTVEATLGWLKAYTARVRDDRMDPTERRALMNGANPKYVLRNYMAQEAIDLATQGDVSRLDTLLDVLRHPYDEQAEHSQFAARRPEWARHKPGCSMLSCSS